MEGSLPVALAFALTLQAATSIGLSVALAISTADCLVRMTVVMACWTALAACGFAIEAVRTENVYQLAAYAASTAILLCGFVPSVTSWAISTGRHMVLALGALAVLMLCALPATSHLHQMPLHVHTSLDRWCHDT